MAWGSDIMMLGRAPQPIPAGTAGSLAGSVKGALRGALAGAPVIDADAAIGYMGQYLGAVAGGAAVGYLVQPKLDAAMRGGLAASSIWQLSDAWNGYKWRSPLMTGATASLGLLGIYWAWRSGRGRR